MKAYKYEIIITIDIVHQAQVIITEYYVPSMNVYFNFYGGLNVFKETDKRFKARHTIDYLEKELDKKVTLTLTHYLNAKEKLEGFAEELGCL